ncbi:hypothetical protein GGF50DRAFT_68733, partial [Schizophyllum commune]
LLSPFDVKKKKTEEGEEDRDDDVDEVDLAELAKDLELEELEMMDELDERQVEEDVDVEIDELEDMSDDEKAALRATCRPVRFMLVKLRKLAYKVINSTTKLLPAWLQCLKDHGLPSTYIPRDVSTRWNSTYDMLDYVVEHAKPLKAYLGDEEHTFDLDVFALSSQEWRCAKQLRKVLKVRAYIISGLACAKGACL